MRQEPYNQNAVRNYLLGTLSQTETERFDELSFTDDLFIEALNSTENDLIDSYVNGELEGQLLDQFEAQYLSSPIRSEKVELARALLDHGVRSVRIEKTTSPITFREKLFPSLAGWRWQTGLAALATLIIVVLAWLVLNNSHWFRSGKQNELAKDERALKPTSETENGNQSATSSAQSDKTKLEPRKKEEEVKSAEPTPQNRSRLATVVLSPQMRGATETPVVSNPPNTGYLGVRLELEPNDYSIYKVELRSEAGGPVLWSSKRVHGHMRDGGKVLALRLPAQLFKPRSYVLQVSGFSESGIEEKISNYHFRIVK